MLKNEYIYQESKNNFKGWTKEGLEFLLSLTCKDKRLKYKIKKELEKLERRKIKC